MVTQTDNYSFDVPDIGGDIDIWGTYLQNNWNKIDVLLNTLQEQVDAMRIPVGGLYMSTVADDPVLILKYGVWVAYAQGRAIVGVGSNDETVWAAGEIRGSETHTLTTSEMPTHTHSADPTQFVASTDSAGTHSHRTIADDVVFTNPLSGAEYTARQHTSSASSFNTELGGSGAVASLGPTNSAGSHQHTITIDVPAFETATNGDDDGHNNVQPSIGVYVWRRIS